MTNAGNCVYMSFSVCFHSATVERLKVLSDERNDPFNDDVLEVPRLCRCLETILRIHQKGHYYKCKLLVHDCDTKQTCPCTDGL